MGNWEVEGSGALGEDETAADAFVFKALIVERKALISSNISNILCSMSTRLWAYLASCSCSQAKRRCSCPC